METLRKKFKLKLFNQHQKSLILLLPSSFYLVFLSSSLSSSCCFLPDSLCHKTENVESSLQSFVHCVLMYSSSATWRLCRCGPVPYLAIKDSFQAYKNRLQVIVHVTGYRLQVHIKGNYTQLKTYMNMNSISILFYFC